MVFGIHVGFLAYMWLLLGEQFDNLGSVVLANLVLRGRVVVKLAAFA